MAFKKITIDFDKVKQSLNEEKDSKEKKTKGNSSEFVNTNVFKPVAVRGLDETKFKLRFLPLEESTTGKPWVELSYHMFQRLGDNKFIKVIDPKTFDKKASNPISEEATRLWNSDNEVDKELAKKMFRKPRYFSIVYVKEAPENQKHFEGKVLIYEYSKVIYDKLNSAINTFDNCFWHPEQGQDFLLVIKIKKTGKDEWPDYALSSWVGRNGPITTNDAEMERISKDLEKLTIKKEVIEKDGVKSGAELLELMNGGLEAIASPAGKSEPSRNLMEELEEKVVEKPVSKPAPKPEQKKPVDFGTSNVTPAKAQPAPKVEAPKEDDFGEINLDDLDFTE